MTTTEYILHLATLKLKLVPDSKILRKVTFESLE